MTGTPAAVTATEILLIANTLWFLPGPARHHFAGGLHSLGVRVHPELATKRLDSRDPAGMGRHRRMELVDATDSARAALAEFNPGLADAVAAAGDDPAARHALRAQLAASNTGVLGDAAGLIEALTQDQEPDR